MHFTVSWDISAKEPRWSQIDEEMRACFKSFPQERPVNTYYMVKVSTAEQYNTIHNCLLSVAKRNTETIHFIMSPLLNVKGYLGYLPQDKWPKINDLTS